MSLRTARRPGQGKELLVARRFVFPGRREGLILVAHERDGAPWARRLCLHLGHPVQHRALKIVLQHRAERTREAGIHATSHDSRLRLPARSPNLNAFAERFVESIRTECLGRIVPLGEAHLRAAVRTFLEHYHEERPHQGLSNALIAPKTTLARRGPVRCKERLGGILKFYYRAAA